MRRDPRKRYSETKAFEWSAPASAPFRGLMPRTVRRHVGFVEYTLKVGDRLDKLAGEFYGDPRLWWAIAEANPQVFLPADLIYADAPDPRTMEAKAKAGTRIVIPERPAAP
ncbi:LysM peptidoglycan-binding domain-containing protein [Rhodovulum sulfidophilum]|uniref:LysM peptidoglycan-binding domain-containing protein n=1 Tax=Rhodovulum sulfidophilum TaxID=35806 RepID=UPI000951289D|nr:hypothetical protein [Rhodovulum sulfidophilum]OLS52127.1 hypothetical protein BV392_09055 [Rhodovulum sulfidophilum]